MYTDSLWRDFDVSDCDEYLDAYARARRVEVESVRSAFPDPAAELGDAFVEHFRRLGEMSPYFLERIDMTVRFELTGAVEGRWDVDLRPEGVRVDLRGRAKRPEYRFPARLTMARARDLRPDRLGRSAPLATVLRLAGS